MTGIRGRTSFASGLGLLAAAFLAATPEAHGSAERDCKKGRGQLQVWQCVSQNLAAIVVDRANQSASERRLLAALEQSIRRSQSTDASGSGKAQRRTTAATAHRLRIVLFLGFCTVIGLAAVWVLYA